ncbi:hypothetical protein QTP70_016989, partial [Hemibagrus guttatus]
MYVRDLVCRLSNCSVAAEGYAALAIALGENPSHLLELDLSGNKVGDSGIKQISNLLQNPHCLLETLRLTDNNIREEGYSALAEALKSSHLIELDLRGNDPGASGVKLLTDLLQDPDCKLNILRLLKSPAAQEVCDLLYRVLGVNPLLQRELNVSEKISGDSQVKQLSALLEDSHCRPEILKLCKCSITEDDCTAVVSALGLNPSHLKELDLSDNTIGDTGVKQLSDLLQNSHCTLEKLKILSPEAEKACDDLTKALGTNPLLQTELDLSGKISGDSGVKQLSVLLKDPQCRTETLRLSDCNITEEGYTALIKALKSNCSSLIELDLRGNDPGPSGLKELRNLMNDKKCKLKTLRVLKSPDAQKASDHLTEVLGINPILQTDLNLSGKIDGDSGVEQLSVLLKDPHCRPETLQLSECNVTEKGCSALLTALRSEHSTLKELNLSKNRIQDSGVKLLSEELKNKLCKLETLRLSDCSITETGYIDLAEALRLNSSSHLRELDLRGNDPGASGVKRLTDNKNPKLTLRLYKEDSMTDDDCSHVISALVLNPSHLRELNLNRNKPGESGLRDLCDFLKNPKCTLQTLKLWSSVKGKSCTDLFSALCTNPSHIRELDLSECELGDSGVKQLSVLLKDPQCRTETLRLNKSSITHRGCTDLISALTSNPSHLTELDLSENTLGNSAMDKISTLLQNSSCKLQKLVLSDCNITEEGYTALIKALKSNCSSLIELDLRGNDPGASGLKELRNLMNDKKCKLKTLRVLKSPDAQKASDHLTEVLGINPILQTDLNLSGKIDGDSGVEQLSVLLKDPHCRPETLQLSECNVTEKGCSALLTALGSEHSTLKELNLSKNRIQDSGVKLLSEELKNKLCKLDTLRLMDNNIREEGYSALAEALKSSHLIELDLRGNDPGASGVKLLTDLLQDPDCKLNRLRLWKSPDAEEAYTCLTKMFSKNPLLHTELDLSKKKPKDVKVKQLSALLQDPHYRLQKLTMDHNKKIIQEVEHWVCSSRNLPDLLPLPCVLAIGDVVGHENIVAASRMNSAIVVFLNDVAKVTKLTGQGIIINNELKLVSPLSSPAKKVILSNVPPFISDKAIANELSRYGRLVSPIKRIRLGCKSSLIKHLMSFRRMVYMVFKEGTEELNVVFKFSVDGFDYNIFVSSDADIKCFKCGRTGHLVRACPERQSDPGVSERPGQEAAEPAVVVLPSATVRPAAESPRVPAAPEQTESEPQAQPAAQKPTGATITPEEPCVAEPVMVKSCSAELVSVRHGDTDRDQEKPCLTEPDLERPSSVDSGAVLELPVLAEAGTEVQSCRLEAPVTTPVHGDGGDVEMEDEPTFKVPTKRKKKEPGDLLSEPTEIRKPTVRFYLKLYSSERSGAQIVEESFLKDLPKLSEQAARELDGELTLAELHKALQSMENGQVPEHVKGRLSRWKRLVSRLSYRGRTLVINNLAASSLWHKLACVDPPQNLLASIQALLVDFFWDGLHWIPQSILHLPKEEGGQGLVQKQNKGCGTLHWLLEEPLIHGGCLDISGVTAPALSRALISSRVVTLRELVNIAGTDLSWAQDLAARLGLRSLLVVNQLLHRWRTVLTSKERVQLIDYQITETNPAEEGSFPQLNIAPDLDGSEGPLLECWGVREMDS